MGTPVALRGRGLVLLIVIALTLAAVGTAAALLMRPAVRPAPDFTITLPDGTDFTLSANRGKVVVIFFGFAQCPDVCPTTLSELAAVARELGKDADRMQVLFVTVDPERDTPEVLRQYVPSFDPRFLGLYGDAEATARAAKAFKIFYQKQPLKDSTTYSVDHSAGTYILDREGRLRLYARYGAGAALLLHDIRILLDS